MPTQSPTQQTLLAENAELRARLEEAEEMLRAIRNGEVDALVVKSSAGPQVFTLQGLDAELNRFRGEILEQVSDAVIVLDDDQYITYLNAAAAQQYGVIASQTLGCHVTKIYQGSWYHPGDEAAMLLALSETGNWRGEKIHLKCNGETIHVETSITRLRAGNGTPNGLLSVIRDISERKISERREQMEQLFRASLASQTAAAIAHELNQPLAAISSYADVALYMLQTGYQDPQKLAHVLENCALQAQRAGDVIRQLLTVLHKGEALSEPIDINSSVRDAIAFVKTDIQLGAFKIELDLDDDLGHVMANGLQIQKVLINLLRNGLESLRESGINAGTMTVTTRCSTDDPTLVQVTVCDSGKGVADSATLRTMFQPFYTTKATGLGMGLTITRTLIEAHGGKMWAEQNVDTGISVHFTLPFAI